MNNQSQGMTEILKQKTLSSSEVLNIISKYKKSESESEKDALRELVFISSAKFIRKQAWKYARHHPSNDVEEFFNAGVIGLYHALDKFKAVKNVKFLTYAGSWINKKMQDCMHSQNLLTIPKNDFYNKNKETLKNHTDQPP